MSTTETHTHQWTDDDGLVHRGSEEEWMAASERMEADYYKRFWRLKNAYDDGDIVFETERIYSDDDMTKVLMAFAQVAMPVIEMLQFRHGKISVHLHYT